MRRRDSALSGKTEQADERDLLLTLYYEGGVGGLFDAIDVDEHLAGNDFEARFCERVLAADPAYIEVLGFLGSIYTKSGEYAKGLELNLRLLKLRPRSPRAHYNAGCCYALMGRSQDALDELARAAELGFSDADHMLADEDLASLRDHPRFKEIAELARRSSGKTV
jgi:lipoprotein NlpI